MSHFPPIFVLIKLTCLVTLFDLKNRFSKIRQNCPFLSKCKRSSLRSQCSLRLFFVIFKHHAVWLRSPNMGCSNDGSWRVVASLASARRPSLDMNRGCLKASVISSSEWLTTCKYKAGAYYCWPTFIRRPSAPQKSSVGFRPSPSPIP